MPLTLLAVALCGLVVPQVRGNVAAPFDSWVLSLSWAPEFCAQPGAAVSNPRQCAAGRNIGFVVQGLWPQTSQGASPVACEPAKSVSKGIVNSMLASMPSPALIQHAWATYGTCTGMNQSSYFTTVLLVRAAVQIPVQISSIAETVTRTPIEIEGQFAGSNPSFPKGAFRVGCANNALTEVRVCFDKDLKARTCAASLDDCSAASITLRPPR